MATQIPFSLDKISMIGGTSREFMFSGVFDDSDYPFNFANCEARFSLVGFNNRSGVPVVSKEMEVTSDGVSAIENNSLFVSLTPEDTINLTPGRYIYQVSIKDPFDNFETLQGLIDIYKNIDESFCSNKEG